MSSDPLISATGSVPAEERHWAMGAHLCGLLWFLGGGSLFFPPAGGALLFTMLGPLIIWKAKGDTMPFAGAQAKEALNFQITVFVLAIVCAILFFLLIGFLFMWVLAVLNLIFVIIAAIQVSDGKPYRYPLCIRFFS
jgi:uncharacterized protein